MSDGVTIEVDASRVLAKFDGLPREVHDALLAKVSALTLQLEAKVAGKLSGEVLQVRTGALRRSIFSTVDDQGATGVYGSAASSGDVKYAAIHEFGYVGTEAVKAHIRHITQAFGQSLKQAVDAQVNAFSRKMNMPERSFLRSSLADMKDTIIADLTEAVQSALHQ